MRLRLAIFFSMISFIAFISISLYYTLAPHAANYFYQKSVEDIKKSDYPQARINYEKSLFLSDEFANPNTTGFIQVYLAYARDLSNKAQQDSKISVSRYLNQAIRAYERALSFNHPSDLTEVINTELANTYYTCASKQVSCKYESDVVANYEKALSFNPPPNLVETINFDLAIIYRNCVLKRASCKYDHNPTTNYKKALDYLSKSGEREENGCMGLTINKKIITHVDSDSPAFKAGVQIGDEILSINGTKVSSSQEIVDLGRAGIAGTLVTLSVNRKGYGKLTFIFPRSSWKKCFIYSMEEEKYGEGNEK